MALLILCLILGFTGWQYVIKKDVKIAHICKFTSHNLPCRLN